MLTAERLGPPISRKEVEPDGIRLVSVSYPFQEQKEQLGNRHYDVTIVYGQGPTKDVRFRSELTPEEQDEYDRVQENPGLHHELAYSVIDDSSHGDDVQTGLDKNPYYNMMEEIKKKDISEEEKLEEIEAMRLEWERAGRYGMMRGGEHNALAAGLALYLDLSDVFILTGGRTISKEREQDLKESFSAEYPGASFDSETYETYLKEHVSSEAELMRDLILRHFGRLMFYRDTDAEAREAEFEREHSREQLNLEFAEKHPAEELDADYQQRRKWLAEQEEENKRLEALGEQPKKIVLEYPLDTPGDYLEARRERHRWSKYREFENKKYQEYIAEFIMPRLRVEDDALTTPENVVYSVNKYPELFGPASKVAVITIDPHLPRAAEFVHRFGGVTSEIDQMSSERLLEHRAKIRNKNLYAAMLRYFYSEPENNLELRERMAVEERKVRQLNTPENIMYWIVFIGMLEDEKRIQGILDEVKEDGKEDHRWIDALSLAFAEAGLFYSDKPEDAERSDNFYGKNIPEFKAADPLGYEAFQKAMLTMIIPAKRDIVFIENNGILERPQQEAA